MAIFSKTATKVIKTLHLSKKSNKKVDSLQIGSPIEGTFVHVTYFSAPDPDVIPDYHANIDENEPVIPRRYSDLLILAENWHRQLLGTRHALVHMRELNHGLERSNTVMHLQIERAGAVMVNYRNLRQEVSTMKKHATEQQETIDTLRSSGGKTRNTLKTEVGLLTLEKTYLEGLLQETFWDVDEHYSKLEQLAMATLDTLADARESGRGVQEQ